MTETHIIQAPVGKLVSVINGAGLSRIGGVTDVGEYALPG